MFEHLDDPAPRRFGASFRAGVLSRGRTLRRRRRAAWAGVASVFLVVLGAAGGYGSALSKVDDVERLEVAGTGSHEDAPVRTVLIVGSDIREGDARIAPPGNTDTLLALRIDQESRSVSALPIPRDLAVTDPAEREPVRINSIAARHGLSDLVRVVETQLGMPIDHVVTVDFRGFVRSVDLVGGIEVHTSAAMRDLSTGLDLPGPECVHLDGMQALQLARARQLQVQIDGQWTTDDRGDLGRIDRLQVLLLAALDRLGDTRPDPLAANRLADWILDNIAVDETLDRDSLVDRARIAMDLGPEALEFGTLPVEPATLENQSSVLTLAEGAGETIRTFNSGLPSGSVSPVMLAACE